MNIRENRMSNRPPRRISEHPIADLFVNRWSPRSFATDEIADSDLFSLFEAARWAPSSNNSQPWSFIYAKRGEAAFNSILSVLSPRNQRWAYAAAALIVVASKKAIEDGQNLKPLLNHSFDTGAAWAHLALQAEHIGLSAHAMGGFDREAARAAVKAPADYDMEAVIAIGKRGDPSMLAEEFQAREFPSSRLPISQFIVRGSFS
jgi:nitroreductase